MPRAHGRRSGPTTSRAPRSIVPQIVALIEKLIARGHAYVGGQSAT